MSDFENEVRGFISQVQSEREWERTHSEDLEGQRREAARAQAEREERIRNIGKDVVDLLFRHSVQPVPIWGKKRGRSDVSELGKGWHVLSIRHYPTEGQPTVSNHAIDTKGRSFEFRYTEFERRYSGIIFPSEPRYGESDLSLLESDFFKKGLASQIAGYGHYTGDIGA